MGVATGDLTWARYAYWASLFLAGGSLILWTGIPMMFLSWGMPFYGATVLGLVLHFAGWFELWQGLRTLRELRGPRLTRQERAMILAFVGSLLGFLAGIGSLIVLYRSPVGWWAPAWLAILAIGLFPYVPSVFAPVVIAHAVLFWIASERFEDSRRARTMVLGSAGLIVVASLGLLAQAVLFTPLLVPWVFAVAGATSIGYLVVASAWRGELRASLRPLPGPEREPTT